MDLAAKIVDMRRRRLVVDPEHLDVQAPVAGLERLVLLHDDVPAADADSFDRVGVGVGVGDRADLCDLGDGGECAGLGAGERVGRAASMAAVLSAVRIAVAAADGCRRRSLSVANAAWRPPRFTSSANGFDPFSGKATALNVPWRSLTNPTSAPPRPVTSYVSARVVPNRRVNVKRRQTSLRARGSITFHMRGSDAVLGDGDVLGRRLRVTRSESHSALPEDGFGQRHEEVRLVVQTGEVLDLMS